MELHRHELIIILAMVFVLTIVVAFGVFVASGIAHQADTTFCERTCERYGPEWELAEIHVEGSRETCYCVRVDDLVDPE